MNLLKLVHVLAAVVAFGLGFAQPMLMRASDQLAEAFKKFAIFVQGPAMLVLAGTGIALTTEDGANISMADPWVSASFVVWIALAVIIGVSAVAAMEKPKIVAPLLGGQHLLLLIALYLMIFQPG